MYILRNDDEISYTFDIVLYCSILCCNDVICIIVLLLLLLLLLFCIIRFSLTLLARICGYLRIIKLIVMQLFPTVTTIHVVRFLVLNFCQP